METSIAGKESYLTEEEEEEENGQKWLPQSPNWPPPPPRRREEEGQDEEREIFMAVCYWRGFHLLFGNERPTHQTNAHGGGGCGRGIGDGWVEGAQHGRVARHVCAHKSRFEIAWD